MLSDEIDDINKIQMSDLVTDIEERGFTDEIIERIADTLESESLCERSMAIFCANSSNDVRLILPVINAMKLEHNSPLAIDHSEYAEFLMSWGDTVLRKMLNIWKDEGSDDYSKKVAREFLTKHLVRPVGKS